VAKIPVLDAIRIIPRDSEFLDRKSGARGEIFYDKDSNTLRLYSGQSAGGISLVKADLSNIANAVFLAKSIAAGVTGGGASSVRVSAEDSTINEATNGIIKFNGLNGVAVTTSATGIVNIIGPSIATAQTAGIVKPGIGLSISGDGALNVSGDIAVEGIASLQFPRGVAVSEFSSDSGMQDNASDTVPTENAVRTYIDRRLGYDHTGTAMSNDGAIPAGGAFRYATEAFVNSRVGNFSALPDATAALLTIDKIYLPAITRLNVTNNGASAYRFDQYGTTDDPTIYAINATTIAFNLQATGHPFLIQDGTGANYNTGLTHVTTAGVVTTGSSAQGKDSGTLYWKIPDTVSGGYRYQCGAHAAMVGTITVKNFGSI
jgi:hypothetical protein